MKIGTQIKHSAPRIRSHQATKTQLYLKPNVPLISTVKKVQKLLNNLPKNAPQVKYISVFAMSRAINNALSLACYLEEEQGLIVDILTGTVAVLDEFKQEEDEEEEESVMQKRLVTKIEVRVWRQDI